MSRVQVLKLLLLGIGILALDMLSKGLVHFYFNPLEHAPHFFPFGGISVFQAGGIDFCIHHVTNRGVAWGLGDSLHSWILAIRIAIIGALGLYLGLSSKAVSQRYGILLVIAGGIGNVIDYFMYGHVIDMLHFIFWGYSYPVFNVADASIFCGIVLLFLQSWIKKKDAIPTN